MKHYQPERPFKRDLCQVDKAWLKGRMQECVTNARGEVVAVCGDDGDMAERIAVALTYAPPMDT